MDSSTDERLAKIETGITGLTDMLGCLFEVVLVKHRMDVFAMKVRQPLSALESSAEDTRQVVNDAVTFVFGGIAVMGLAVAGAALNQANPTTFSWIAPVGLGVVALLSLLFAVKCIRRAKSQQKEARGQLARMREDLWKAEKEAQELDEALAQAVARWEALGSASNGPVRAASGDHTPDGNQDGTPA